MSSTRFEAIPQTMRGLHTALGILVCLWTVPSLASELPMRWRWSNPRPHGANVSGMAHKDGLTVQVGERGQIFTSRDLDFWQPEDSGTLRWLRAVTFFGNRIIITGERGTVVTTDNTGNFHPINLGTPDWLEGVTASPDLLVAVGDSGAIYTSRDGLDWQRQPNLFTNWLTSVTYGPDGFVAVGHRGIVLSSPNGTNWVRQANAETVNLNEVKWIGNDYWVVGDRGRVLRRGTPGADGWTLASSTVGTNHLLTISGDFASKVAAGEGPVWLRNEFSPWSDQTQANTPFPAPRWTYTRSFKAGQLYFLAGRTGMMVEGFQTNLLADYTWINRERSVRNWLWEVKRWPGLYAAVGHRGTIMTSVDGIDWSLEVPPDITTTESLLGIGGNEDLMVAVGSNGQIWLSSAIETNLVHTNRATIAASSASSTLGIIWEAVRPEPATNDLQGVAMWDDTIVVSGENGIIMTSQNGAEWVKQSTPTTAYLSSLAATPLGMVAVGAGGTLLASPNAREWSRVPLPLNEWIYKVRFVGGMVVAVGQNGLILVGNDGLNWSRREANTRRWLNDVTFSDGKWYVVGNQGTVLASPNLQEWLNLGTITGKSLFGIATDGRQLVTVGVEGVILRTYTRPNLDPVRFLKFSRDSHRNLFLIEGAPDQRIILESSIRIQNWNSGPVLDFLDATGTLLLLGPENLDAPPQEFFRARTVP